MRKEVYVEASVEVEIEFDDCEVMELLEENGISLVDVYNNGSSEEALDVVREYINDYGTTARGAIFNVLSEDGGDDYDVASITKERDALKDKLERAQSELNSLARLVLNVELDLMRAHVAVEDVLKEATLATTFNVADIQLQRPVVQYPVETNGTGSNVINPDGSGGE